MKCAVDGCFNDRAKNRTVCYTHHTQMFKKNNPVKYAYFVVKNNAKRRGKEFSLSFEHFKKVVEESAYMQLKGRSSGDLSLDRKDEDVGYVDGNIRVVTNKTNIKKRFSWARGGNLDKAFDRAVSNDPF